MHHKNGKTPQPAVAIMALPEMSIQPDATTMQPDATTMQSDATTVQPNATTVQPDATTVQPDATTVQPDATTVQPDATRSHRNQRGFAANVSISTRLVVSQVEIDRVLGDPRLQERMAARGYPATRMLQGRARRDQALALHQQQRNAYATRIAATKMRVAAQSQAQATYTRHIALARVALHDNPSAAWALDLTAPRKRTRAGWLIQAQNFYANLLANPALIAGMAEYGVMVKELAGVQDTIAEIEAALVAQRTTKDAAKAATRVRDVALDALNRWMRDFLAVAKVALAE